MKLYPKVRAEIDRAALINNYNIVQSKIGNTPQCCVVKADCYGHGIECAGVFYDLGCRFFAVSGSGEALVLRDFLISRGAEAEILILGYVDACDIPALADCGIICAMFSREYAELCAPHIPRGKKLRVHIKLNTGMNRLGFDETELDDCLSVCRRQELSVEGAFTHFARADELGDGERATEKQLEVFASSLDYLKSRGVDFRVVHAFNSAATKTHAVKYDMVRSGIVLYGMNPSDDCIIPGIIPAMTVKTAVAQVHILRAGQSVSYGGEFTAPADMRVATVPIGYADGFIRAYKDGYMTVKGKRAKILGRICMDQCVIDITDIENVKCGDGVVVFGRDGISADELAKMADTINYEVVCLISKRVLRELV